MVEGAYQNRTGAWFRNESHNHAHGAHAEFVTPLAGVFGTDFVSPLACLAWLASVAVTAAVLSPIEGGPVRAILIIAAIFGLLVCVLPTAGTAVVPARYSQAQLQQIVRHVFPDDQARALCISDYESDGSPHHWTAAALNGSNTGLFQIDRSTWDWRLNPRAIPVVGRLDWSRMLEPLYNARAARRIYVHSGWRPWSTRGLCGA